jgi:polyhydroxybutyrate depolymerase
MMILLALTFLAVADDATHTMDVAGASRTYKLHIPASVAADVRAPLVVVLHGGGGNADAIAQNSQFSEKADREKFIVAYPEGVGRQPNAYTWNAGHCCAFAMTSHSADIEFLTKLLDDIAKVHPIDVKRVYFCGMSNGGMMTYRLLGSIANRIAAAGIVSGAMFADQPKPSEPVPIIIFHGTADPVLPFNGGASPNATVAASVDAPFLSAPAAFDFWSKADGCGGTGMTQVSRASMYFTEKCGSVMMVQFHEIPDGVHAWPGGVRSPAEDRTLNATDLMWDFFKSHPKQ